MNTDLSTKTDAQLESMWQNTADMISSLVMQYYKSGDASFKVEAEKQQSRQSEIDAEIARRGV
jgi:hypothetical protein